MNPIRVSNIALSLTTHAEVSAQIEGLQFAPKGARLWFRFPVELGGDISDGGEPFVAALLPIAMSRRQTLVVDGPVSDQFLAGCRRIMALYHSWDRRLHTIELQASTVVRRSEESLSTACFSLEGSTHFTVF